MRRTPRRAFSIELAARKRREGKPEAMIAKISQETLAEMIGTSTIPHVRLRRAGLR